METLRDATRPWAADLYQLLEVAPLLAVLVK